MRSRLLKKSIHKGRILGLSRRIAEDSAIHDLDDLPPCASQHQYWLVLEHMDDGVDVLDHHVLTTAALLTPHDFDAINLELVRDLAYASDHIEGSTVRWRDSQRFDIERRAFEGMPQDDVEFICHCQTIRDLVLPRAHQRLEHITEEYIKALHASLRLVDMEDADRGHYERVQNYPASRQLENEEGYFAPPDQVPQRMDAMLRALHSRSEQLTSRRDVLSTAAWLHQQFVQIHPFVDGNGRTGRLLLDAFLLQHGLPLSSIQPDLRFVYYAGLHAAHTLQTAPKEGAPPLALLHRIVSESVLRSLELTDADEL